MQPQSYLISYVAYYDFLLVVLGHLCEQHNNPADFFLDVISANESSVEECKYMTCMNLNIW